MSKSDGRSSYLDRPLVYIVGPYTSPDPVENTHHTIEVAGRLIDEGFMTPVVPHLTLLWHLVQPREIDFWYEYDLAILVRCDAVLRLPGKSTGADREVAFAKREDIPVFEDELTLSHWIKTVWSPT